MHGRIIARMDQFYVGRAYEWMNASSDGCKDALMLDGWIYGWMDAWMDGWMDEWMDDHHAVY